MKLEELVPPLELCKLIPQGEFEDSVALWVFFPKSDKKFHLYLREDINWDKAEKYPAPTLEEIMAELPSCVCYRMNKEWSVGLVNDSAENAIKDSSGATAALKLWLKLKGIEYGK